MPAKYTWLRHPDRFSRAWLGRRLGLSWTATVLAVVLLVLRGRLLISIYTPNQLESVAWWPLGAVAVLALARGGTLFDVIWLAIAN